ncbi:MBL fold metallo-hydrolase, partial [bacterium]
MQMGDSPAGQDTVLRLHVVQADYGDSLVLEYGRAAAPHFMLIDGGPPGVYSQHLKPALQQLAQGGAALDAILLTHVDEDHVAGLVDLAYDLVEAKDQA